MIEKDFHIIQSVLELRPVHHRTDAEARAHVGSRQCDVHGGTVRPCPRCVSRLTSPYASMVGFFPNNYQFQSPARPPDGASQRFRLHAYDGRYVVPEGGGGGVVNADRTWGRAWETFSAERTSGGPLAGRELVNLREVR